MSELLRHPEVLRAVPELAHVARALDLVAIAAAELDRFELEHPERTTELRIPFQVLAPSRVLEGFVPTVYRAHVRELIQRVLAGVPLEPGTDAECLCALSRTSLKAPLNDLGQACVERLFRSVLGAGALAVLGPAGAAHEPWPGAADELLADLRRKLAQQRAPSQKEVHRG